MNRMSQTSLETGPTRGRRPWPWVAAVVAVLLVAGAGGGYLYVRHREDAADQAARDLAGRVASALQRGDVSALPFTKGDAAAQQKVYAAATAALGKASTTSARVTREQR